MIAVAGYLLLDPEDRDRYVDAFRGLVRQARQAPGCLDVSITADSVDPARVNNFELWASQPDLDAFRATADVPQLDLEIHDAVMQEYLISRSRDPFSTD